MQEEWNWLEYHVNTTSYATLQLCTQTIYKATWRNLYDVYVYTTWQKGAHAYFLLTEIRLVEKKAEFV